MWVKNALEWTFLALSDRTELLSTKGRKSNTTKLLVVIAVEILHPKGFGRVRIQQIERGNHDNLMPFIKASIAPGSLIHTDGSPLLLTAKLKKMDTSTDKQFTFVQPHQLMSLC